MSIAALSKVAVARTEDLPGDLPTDMESTNRAAHGSAAENPTTDALGAIVAYIPSEVILLYVAGLAAISSDSRSLTGQWILFWVLLVATPLALWLTYGSRLVTAGRGLPLHPKRWPKVEMAFATIAFAAWAAALPDSPFREIENYGQALSGFVVLAVTVILPMVAPVVGRWQLEPPPPAA